jgi:uncharacterized protein (DUF2384 family)
VIIVDIQTLRTDSNLEYIKNHLSDFYTPAETTLWLHTPHPLLEGERAIDVVNQGGVEKVLAIIKRLDSGAYS